MRQRTNVYYHRIHLGNGLGLWSTTQIRASSKHLGSDIFEVKSKEEIKWTLRIEIRVQHYPKT